MPPSNYGPLSQVEDSEEHPTSAHASTEVLSSTPIRPAIYYGDGPFDPPSSESDESEVLLEKPLTPGAAERAEYPTLGEEDEGVADNGLFVGGRRKQVRLILRIISESMLSIIMIIVLWSCAAMVIYTVARVLTRWTPLLRRSRRHIRRTFLQRDETHSPGA